MTDPIVLHHGDNGEHEFYETADSETCIIHAPLGYWIAIRLDGELSPVNRELQATAPPGTTYPLSGPNAESVIRRAAGQYGLAFVVDREREWRYPSPRHKTMRLTVAVEGIAA